IQRSNRVVGAKNAKENASYMKQHSSEGIVTHLEMIVRSIMGISTSSTVDHGQGFVDMGMDSFMMVELRSRLMKEFPMQSDQIQSTIAFDYPTVEKLTKFLEHILVVHGDEPSRSVNSVVHSGVIPDCRKPPANDLIAIVGSSIHFPVAPLSENERLQQVLLVGENTSCEIPQERFNVCEHLCDEVDDGQPRGIYTTKGYFTNGMYKKFDTNFFRITPREAKSMDPQQRLLLMTIWHMFEGNGQKPSALKETHVSHFIGISVCEYQELISDVTDVYMTTSSSLSFAAGRVSYFCGLQGPAAAIDSACSSSVVAMHLTS
ncbi:MAG: type I polyketide synthase, partial [Mesoflavibacter sp.]|nr:type I polyketide synthase [Mesoflavibacter sp.]